MTMMGSFRGPASFKARMDAHTMVKMCGLSSGLLWALDAGCTASYPGSGQTVTDLSPASNDWFLGTGVGADGRDPAWVGTAGRQSSGEYFEYTPANDDIISHESGTAQAFHSIWHQNNAIFSTIFVGYLVDTAANQRIWSDRLTNDAAIFYVDDADYSLEFDCITSAGVDTSSGAFSTAVLDVDAWNVVGMAMDEANTTSHWLVNESIKTRTDTTYAAPSATTSSGTLCIGGDPSSTADRIWGGRWAWSLQWNIALGAVAMTAFRTMAGGKWGV